MQVAHKTKPGGLSASRWVTLLAGALSAVAIIMDLPGGVARGMAGIPMGVLFFLHLRELRHRAEWGKAFPDPRRPLAWLAIEAMCIALAVSVVVLA